MENLNKVFDFYDFIFFFPVTDLPTSNRAVSLRWFANKSNQTLGFETANEVKIDDKDC